MRILVLSDTHRHLEPMKRAIAQAGPVDYIFHLGDNTLDVAQISKYSDAKVVRVKGNCDSIGEAEQTVFLEGQRLLYNPGSVGEPRGGHRPTFGLLLVTRDGIFPKTVELR